MDIISIVNTMQPGTISALARNAADFHGEPSVPFMGVFVQLVPGATLPDPAAVTAYETTYLANIAASEAEALATAQAADPLNQIATLTAALINAKVITADALPAAQISAVNATLNDLGTPEIPIKNVVSTSLSSA